MSTSVVLKIMLNRNRKAAIYEAMALEITRTGTFIAAFCIGPQPQLFPTGADWKLLSSSVPLPLLSISSFPLSSSAVSEMPTINDYLPAGWSKEHTELLQDDRSDTEEPTLRRKPSISSTKLNFILAAIICMQSALLFLQWYFPATNEPSDLYGPTGLDRIPRLERLKSVASPYISDNETANDKIWSEIEPGHGLITVTKEWAASMDLEETMDDPSNPANKIYFVGAYHDMHCIQWIRAWFFRLQAGEQFPYPAHQMEHGKHCFDTLRQSIMCHADDTLLHTFGGRDAGAGQRYKCRDWDALREWATERTVCYRDREFPSTVTRWGECDGGNDGLPRGSLTGEL